MALFKLPLLKRDILFHALICSYPNRDIDWCSRLWCKLEEKSRTEYTFPSKYVDLQKGNKNGLSIIILMAKEFCITARFGSINH